MWTKILHQFHFNIIFSFEFQILRIVTSVKIKIRGSWKSNLKPWNNWQASSEMESYSSPFIHTSDGDAHAITIEWNKKACNVNAKTRHGVWSLTSIKMLICFSPRNDGRMVIVITYTWHLCGRQFCSIFFSSIFLVVLLRETTAMLHNVIRNNTPGEMYNVHIYQSVYVYDVDGGRRHRHRRCRSLSIIRLLVFTWNGWSSKSIGELLLVWFIAMRPLKLTPSNNVMVLAVW